LRRYFGTDGVRGVVGEDLTPELVEQLGRAATLWSDGGRVFVGRDTRASGEELEEAFARGVVAAGGNAVLASPRRATSTTSSSASAPTSRA
jgi:phosphomannomutase